MRRHSGFLSEYAAEIFRIVGIAHFFRNFIDVMICMLKQKHRLRDPQFRQVLRKAHAVFLFELAPEIIYVHIQHVFSDLFQ